MSESTKLKTRFCRQCMIHVNLTPDLSKLALPASSQNRLAFCDGPLHNRAITVDPHGAYVGDSTKGTTNDDKWSPHSLVVGHSLLAR